MGRGLFITASLILHGLVAAAAFRVPPKTQVKKKPTTVAVVRVPKPPVATPEPPPPRLERPSRLPTPKAAVRTPAPVATGLVLSNAIAPAATSSSAPARLLAALSSAPRELSPTRDLGERDSVDCDTPPEKPQVISRARDIEYTDEARAHGLEGRLVLRVTVSSAGEVTLVEVVSGIEASFDAAAVEAVKTWRFAPASRCGVAVEGGTYTLARRFELGD